MTFIFETKQIDRSTYEKIARRYVWLMFGSEVWKSMNENWDIHIIPVEQSDKYRQMYSLTKWDTNPSIPWGFTQPPNIVSNELQRGRIFWFVNDTSNPFIIRQNAEKGNHEFAHGGCYIVFGNKRRTRKFSDPQASAGTEGPAYVTLVHDIAYGYRDLFKYWIRWKFTWIPISGLNVRKYL